MYKILLIIGTIIIVHSCKSSQSNCDAYGSNYTHKKES